MRRYLAATIALLTTTTALAQADRTILPIPTTPFNGQIAENVADSRPSPPQAVRAPQGAPNVFLMMSDDVGFAMSSTFGGPVPTPNYERLAASGQRFNRFHTTAICSPSRAALLTGRNSHNAGVGFLSDQPMGYPGYGGRILPETATIAQMLRLNGYNTAMVGKHHNTPPAERSEAGPFDAWPTGLGFEHYFGFVGGDVDQYAPVLVRGTSPVDPDEGRNKILDQRFADEMIRWLHNQNAAAPDKPFLLYFAPGSAHAPHQVSPEYIARFKGKFDMGWDRLREETLRRQIAMEIVPKGTRLSPRSPTIPAWDTLSIEQKAFAARSMEVAAAVLTFQDEQVGRVLDELGRMGLADNTLIALIQGDNGASGEAGPKGTINELRSVGVHDENEAWILSNKDQLGGPKSYGNYPVAWAWAMNTPLPMVKQYASQMGGIRNGMILSWAGHVAKPGSVCGQFSHLIDIVPTILEAASLPAPKTVLGAQQKPIDGQSLLPSLTACDAAKPRTQYFEIAGKIGLYHNGWFLSGENGRNSWENSAEGGTRPKVTWSLYNLDKDFSQSTDLAAREPARLATMRALWQEEAKRNNVFPLEHRFGAPRTGPTVAGLQRKHLDLWGKDVSMPAMAGPFLAARAFTVTADISLDRADASGAVLAWGSWFGGWSLYLDKGRPSFVWARSTDPAEMAQVTSATPLPAGPSKLTLRFAPKGFGQPADVVLSVGGTEYARVTTPQSMLMPAGGSETLDVGRDLGVPVTQYASPHGAIEGDVRHVSIDFD